MFSGGVSSAFVRSVLLIRTCVRRCENGFRIVWMRLELAEVVVSSSVKVLIHVKRGWNSDKQGFAAFDGFDSESNQNSPEVASS